MVVDGHDGVALWAVFVCFTAAIVALEINLPRCGLDYEYDSRQSN